MKFDFVFIVAVVGHSKGAVTELMVVVAFLVAHASNKAV